MKNKIKPHFMGWYENDFQAELGVRRMKPIERHFYRALLIQSFFCAERPYLPNDDDQLWVLADADSKEHWKEHRDVVMGMFKKYGATRWGHPRVLRDWKATEDKYTGKRKLQDTLGQTEGGVTGGKQTRPDQTTLTPDENNSNPKQNRPKASGSGDQGRADALPCPAQVRKGGQEGVSSVSDKAPFSTETGSENHMSASVRLVSSFWKTVAERKNDNGRWCGDEASNDVSAMRAAVQGYGEEKVMLALQHFSRSDYWGQSEAGKVSGVSGFCKAIPALLKQANNYVAKVRETNAAAKKQNKFGASFEDGERIPNVEEL